MRAKVKKKKKNQQKKHTQNTQHPFSYPLPFSLYVYNNFRSFYFTESNNYKMKILIFL